MWTIVQQQIILKAAPPGATEKKPQADEQAKDAVTKSDGKGAKKPQLKSGPSQSQKTAPEKRKSASGTASARRNSSRKKRKR
jgi:hypothetical protein